ncbi:MAG: phage holin family protein [Lactobacillaceae bacterium]|jgi:putative membrane protein|nr:phage holin family protein [Lactobacillaceae bacterium]
MKIEKQIDFKSFSFVQRWVINTIMLLALAGFFHTGMHIASVWTGILAAFVLGILNAILRPVLQLISLPLTLLTFGLFGFVVNAFVLWLTSFVIGAGFHFTSFGWALMISIIMTAVNLVLSNYFTKK